MILHALSEYPWILAGVLVGVVAAVVAFSKTRAGGNFFKFLPVPFYCYFVPILGATAGVFPADSTVYGFLSQHVLPPCLVLLLLGSPWEELARVGRQAILAMVFGTVAMFAGAAAGYAAVRTHLPPDSWMAAGALLGSWTGGSANMMAVKEALSMPQSLLAPIIIVDTVMAYGWMALLIALAGFQIQIDGRLRADRASLDRIAKDSGLAGDSTNSPKVTLKGDLLAWRALMIASAVAFGEISVYAGKYLTHLLPVLNLSAKAWTVILATTVGLVLSVTPVRRWEAFGASKMGTTILLLMLTSYGAQTDLRAILASPAFMAFGAIMVLTHGVILALFGRLFRIPLFYLATASQACIGGPVSTPIVSGVYQPSLTHVGVILALIGGAIGTYVGLLGAAFCHWMG